MLLPVEHLHLVVPAPGLTEATRPSWTATTKVYLDEHGNGVVHERGKKIRIPAANIKFAEMREEPAAAAPVQYWDEETVEIVDTYGRRIRVPAKEMASGRPAPAPGAPLSLLPEGAVEHASGPDPDLSREFPPMTPEQLEVARRKRAALAEKAGVTDMSSAAKEHERSVRQEMTRHAVAVEASASGSLTPKELAKLQHALAQEQRTVASQQTAIASQQAEMSAMRAELASLRAQMQDATGQAAPARKRSRAKAPKPEAPGRPPFLPTTE